jgi:hypothetical protein
MPGTVLLQLLGYIVTYYYRGIIVFLRGDGDVIAVLRIRDIRCRGGYREYGNRGQYTINNTNSGYIQLYLPNSHSPSVRPNLKHNSTVQSTSRPVN